MKITVVPAGTFSGEVYMKGKKDQDECKLSYGSGNSGLHTFDVEDADCGGVTKDAVRKEGHILFNDTLNTFYLRLYGVRYIISDHSERERGNPLSQHGLLFPIRSRGILYASIHRQDNNYHGLCYTSRGAQAGTKNSPMGPP